MKAILADNRRHMIRLDRGEEVIARLTEYCREQGIGAASFTGIGACGSATLSYYDLPGKKYHDREYDDDMEIVSLTGNVALSAGEPFVHAHASLAGADHAAVGGHVKRLVVSATCEIFLIALSGEMARQTDEATGLKLLS